MYLPAPKMGPVKRLLFRMCWPILRRVSKIDHPDRAYGAGVAVSSHSQLACLQEAKIGWHVSDADLARIPKHGPVIMISNHPFGMGEGVLQGVLLRSVREDYQQIVNEMLGVFPAFSKRYILVNAFESNTARQQNSSPLREVLAWLRGGHAVATFPAGAVSHRTWSRRKALDPPWTSSIVMLAKRSNATVIPLFFHGQNPWYFQWAGLISARLRTMLIPRAFADMRGKSIRTEIGLPIPAERLKAFSDRKAAIEYLRGRVYMLEARREEQPTSAPPAAEAIAPDESAASGATFAAEIAALPPDNHLGDSGKMSVYMARGERIPLILQEIGRLREVTFRAVGEGTGNAVDLDDYDQTYRHLFIWNRKTEEIVGSYRLGLTDEIMASRGLEGFYTRTLFDYDERMLEGFGDSIELGRSFIRPEYQRGFKPLMLLWRGISNFAAQQRRYRYCFGVVTISNDYTETSKELMTKFLVNTEMLESHRSLVRSRTPYVPKPIDGIDIQALLKGCSTIEDIDELVRDIEQTKLGVPVLVRQYLKLNAKLLAPFNVDHTFADCIDGLMLVDFMQVERRIAHFYLGRKLAAAFRTYHGFEPFSDNDDSEDSPSG
jgi:putative hemolysin